jgi:hypothetical protein
MMKAYAFKDFKTACNLLYQFNKFFLGFKMGIEDLPPPNDPDRTDIESRRHPEIYYITYFETYAPMLALILGQYQHEVLQYIKEEHGN